MKREGAAPTQRSRIALSVRGRIGASITATLTAMALSTLTSCEFESFVSESPRSTCEEVGAQCQLPNGPLGVCELTSCALGVSPPCFKCTSQH
jgi:hypothetical protein